MKKAIRNPLCLGQLKLPIERGRDVAYELYMRLAASAPALVSLVYE